MCASSCVPGACRLRALHPSTEASVKSSMLLRFKRVVQALLAADDPDVLDKSLGGGYKIGILWKQLNQSLGGSERNKHLSETFSAAIELVYWLRPRILYELMCVSIWRGQKISKCSYVT